MVFVRHKLHYVYKRIVLLFLDSKWSEECIGFFFNYMHSFESEEVLWLSPNKNNKIRNKF